MGLLDYAVDFDKVIDITFEGFPVKAKYISATDSIRWATDNVPSLDESATQEMKDQRMDLLVSKQREYLARFSVVGWNDREVPFSEEKAVEILTNPAFEGLATAIHSRATSGAAFKMSRDEAAKKFAPGTLDESKSGDVTTLTKASA